MQIKPELRLAIARAVHQVVVGLDPDGNGLWRCEMYAGIGARLLYALTGDYYEPVAGQAGYLSPEVATAELKTRRHASGAPLDAEPPWADQVKVTDPLGHAWIEHRFAGEVVDLSVRPVIWGRRSAAGDVGGHVFNLVLRDTATFQTKYDLSLVDDLAGAALATVAPRALQSANGSTGHILGRIADRWPKLANRLLDEYNRRL